MTDRTIDAAMQPLRSDRRPGLAERLVWSQASRLAVGTLDVTMPDGAHRRLRGARPGPAAEIVIHRPRLFGRILRGGMLAAAEAYLDGDWDSPDLTAFLELGARNQAILDDPNRRSALRSAMDNMIHLLRRNSRRGAKRNIAAHYDLGNAFFAAWLDPTMTYSAGLFLDSDDDLEAAQLRKYRQMADLAGIRPGEHVLEIGCGWGGFSLWAARERDCRVTAVTLSQAQFDHCRAQVAEAGLRDRVDIRLEDYRDINGRYDRIVSIEMLEAVGERQWPVFAGRVHDLLGPGGRAALQVITIDDARFAAYRRRVDFVQRYVFPGGMLPSPGALRAMAADADLAWDAESRDGLGYARTLAHWRRRFAAAEAQVAELGFDVRFRRLWRFYLSYCEAGFRTGRVDLMRFALCRR